MTDFILQNSAPGASEVDYKNKIDTAKWLRLIDSQHGNYSGNEVILNNLALASHSEYLDCKTSYLEGSWVQSIEALHDFKTEANVNMLSTIKACSAGVINNVMIKIGGTPVVGWQENCTVPLYIDMCSQMTPLAEDVADMQLYAKDNNLSVNYHNAATNNKIGLNNAFPNDVLRNTTNGLAACVPGNNGLMTKLNMMNTTADAYVTETGLVSSVRCFVKRVTSKQIAIYYRLYIPLTSIHSVFSKIPLCKSTQISLNLLINQSQTTFTLVDGKISNINVTTTSSGVNSQHLNYAGISGMMAVAATSTTVTCNSAVNARGTVPPNPLGTDWQFVARLYEFAHPYASQLLLNPKRTCTFEQSEYHLLQGIGSNANYTATITNSVSRPTRLILGFTQAQQLGLTDEISDIIYTDVGTTQASPVSNEASPFCCAPYQTIPGSASIGDFQVFSGGTSVFKEGAISDSRELYEMFIRTQCNEGNYDNQTVSGISYKEFMGAFGWVVVDLTQNNSTLTAQWLQSKDITVKFRSNHRSTLQCHAFIMSETDFTLDISNGKLITK